MFSKSLMWLMLSLARVGPSRPRRELPRAYLENMYDKPRVNAGLISHADRS